MTFQLNIQQKTGLVNYFPNISTEAINSEKSKTNKPQNWFLNCHRDYYNINQQYKNNKLKIIAPTWNDEFKLHDGSY